MEHTTLDALNAAHAQDGPWRTAGYAGPVSLDRAQALCDELKVKQHGTGDPIFPNMQVVRQGDGYNIAYQDLPVKPWRPTGNPIFDDLIERFGREMRVNERGNTLYDGHTLGDAYKIEQLIAPHGFFEQAAWRDGYYRSVWTHPTLFSVITFCEGDLDIVICPDEEHYSDETGNAATFYRAGYIGEPHEG
jgi:hypothetical protein